jgi:16S rRNA (adenine1518-N6/adenine1519-N6)-dimethyltransferase
MPLARKRFGQHFLERAWAEKLVRLIAPQPDETLVEIGPGRGALTLPVASLAKRVIGFEIDRDLAADLRATAPPTVTLVEGDFLGVTATGLNRALKHAGFDGTAFRVIGNLPYNVASPILFKLVDLRESGVGITEAVLMLQREVAARLVARPGTRDYGVLSVLIGRHADIETLLRLPPGAFRPAPRV